MDWIDWLFYIFIGTASTFLISLFCIIIYASATYEKPASMLYQECIDLLKDSDKCKILLPEVKPAMTIER